MTRQIITGTLVKNPISSISYGWISPKRVQTFVYMYKYKEIKFTNLRFGFFLRKKVVEYNKFCCIWKKILWAHAFESEMFLIYSAFLSEWIMNLNNDFGYRAHFHSLYLGEILKREFVSGHPSASTSLLFRKKNTRDVYL